jgi:vanillate/3-O-methylgallate O-demethylase
LVSHARQPVIRSHRGPPYFGSKILALTPINKEHATPGIQVTVTWGEHPGAGVGPDADLGFPKLRATVAPAPYDAYAATEYRRH